LIDYVDLLKISEEELEFVGGEKNIHTYMEEHDISVIVLTRGGDGATVFYSLSSGTGGDVLKGKTDIPSVKVKVVDTTGAGDAYWGGFLSYLLMNGVKTEKDITLKLLEDAGKYGAVSGGICVTRPGGIPALPYRKEIEEFGGYGVEEN